MRFVVFGRQPGPIRHFVDDVLENKRSSENGDSHEKIERLAAVLEEFNLKRRLRQVEDRLKDVEMRNFFDDITLQFVLQDRVPTSNDLERLYVGAKRK